MSLYEAEEEKTQREGHIEMEAEIGVWGHRPRPGDTRIWNRQEAFSLQPLEVCVACRHLAFRLLVSEL